MTKHDCTPQVLRRNLCGLWPDCSCSKTLKHWNQRFADPNIQLATDELAAAEMLIYFALECAGTYCPDANMRRDCAVQLLNPWWNRCRRGEWLTQQECERIRQRSRHRE
jgi:hypothetical protein